MKETTEVTIYLDGIPASKSDPFKVLVEENEIVTLKEKLEEVKSYKVKVEPNDYEKQQLYVTIQLKMESKGVDFKQRINITIGGKHIMIKFVEGTFKIETSRNPFEGTDESPKKEKIHITLSKCKPLRIFLGHKYIYKLSKEAKPSKDVDIDVKLNHPEQYLNFRILDVNEEKELLTKKVDIGNNGEYFKITSKDDDFVLLQKTEDGKYQESEEVEEKSEPVETKIYFLGVEFDKEKKLSVFLDGKRIHTLSKKVDPISGVKVDLEKDNLKRKFKVTGGKSDLNESKEFDISKGAHLLLNLTSDGVVEWKQSEKPFRFGYKKTDDDQKVITLVED